MLYLNSFEIGRQWDRLLPMGQALGDGLKHIFCREGHYNTTCSSQSYFEVCGVVRQKRDPCISLVEATVYEFMSEHSNSSAAIFLVAIRFSHYVLGVTGGGTVLSSKRIEGCAKKAYLKKRRTLQKDPLTVSMVEHLERIVMTDRYMDRDRVAARCFLMCVFFRARFSDMMNLQDLILDELMVQGSPQGYIEGGVGRTKAAYTTEMKTRYLPMVAPRFGVTGLIGSMLG